MAATRDVLAERLRSVLYNRMMENMGYGQQERLKDIAEKEAEKEEEPAAAKEEGEAKEQQDHDDDDERYDTVGKVKLVRKGKRLKEYRVTGNLDNDNTRMIMVNITPHLEMRVKVIYSFKPVIYRGDGKIQPYIKTLDSSPGIFTNLEEIQAYIEECEQKRLDLDNEEVW